MPSGEAAAFAARRFFSFFPLPMMIKIKSTGENLSGQEM
jgi:hypothetical protein